MVGIPRIDFFDFLFNGGRGIRTTQVDWAVTDDDLNQLLSSLTGSGNTAFALTAEPDDADGLDGDIAISLVSATELRGYKKESGAWTQVWTFSGGGGGLTEAQANALIAPFARAIRQDDDLLPLDALVADPTAVGTYVRVQTINGVRSLFFGPITSDPLEFTYAALPPTSFSALVDNAQLGWHHVLVIPAQCSPEEMWVRYLITTNTDEGRVLHVRR